MNAKPINEQTREELEDHIITLDGCGKSYKRRCLEEILEREGRKLTIAQKRHSEVKMELMNSVMETLDLKHQITKLSTASSARVNRIFEWIMLNHEDLGSDRLLKCPKCGLEQPGEDPAIEMDCLPCFLSDPDPMLDELLRLQKELEVLLGDFKSLEEDEKRIKHKIDKVNSLICKAKSEGKTSIDVVNLEEAFRNLW